MTTEEQKNVELTIENTILKAFEKAFDVMDKKISHHVETCQNVSRETKSRFSIGSLVQYAQGILLIILVLTALMSKISVKKFSPEELQQLAKQMQSIVAPTTGNN
jgi:predicted HicB family RNase H-like nuclease